MKHTLNVNNEKANCRIEIRLSDECKNGHEDFAITGTFWEVGKARIDRYHVMSGCSHEEILRLFPVFKIFVDLHLCDFKGAPMHATANGFYGTITNP